MIFRPLEVAGAFLVEPELAVDDRGHFARIWCRKEFVAQGLPDRLAQCSLSYSHRAGTLRGLHWQAPPHAEAKLIRCLRGAIWDVVVDLRPDSATYLRHAAAELSAENSLAMYAPERCAHGFVTLTDGAEVLYQMSEFYEPAAARGARWNDPAFGIVWPVANPILHPRDAAYPDFSPESAP